MPIKALTISIIIGALLAVLVGLLLPHLLVELDFVYGGM